MAQIDKANLGGGVTDHANISDIVGIGGKNNKDDVTLIQALFILVGIDNERVNRFFGMRLNDLPEVTGIMDDKTIQAIWRFQRKNAGHLLNIDGKIHPANYKNRVIKNPQGRVMAITFLNIWAFDTAFARWSLDVIPALKIIAPQLRL